MALLFPQNDMAFGAASRRGASQPATDGSQTAGASRAPSGASLVEGHLTKHWDGDDKVGGAHQAVTDADKKSEMIKVSVQRRQQQQQHQQALLGPGLDA